MSKNITVILLVMLLTMAFTPVAHSSPTSDTAGPGFPRPRADAFTTCATQSEIPQTECEALVALYDSTNGDSWTDNTGWKQTDTPCSWQGVNCTSGHVTGLLLFSNQLNGSIPTEIGNLTNLSDLYLYGNQLSGSIPPEIGNLVNLLKIYLHNNQLTGSIPPEIGNLTILTDLFLDNNQLTGSIPPEIGNLASLKRLTLPKNSFTGSIPPEIGNLINLTILALNNNQLTGSIPPEIGNLTSLTSLSLNNNQLTGSIPPEIGNLTGLTWLSLNNNQLTGSIPPEIGNLAALNNIKLEYNQLSGSIPPEIGNLTNLQGLYLSNNQLSGPLPISLTNITNLEWFYYNNTDLCEPNNIDFQTWLEAIPNRIGTGRCLLDVNDLAASDGTSADMVSLTWTASKGATNYQVFRATTADGEKTQIKTLTGTAYNDRTAEAGKKYHYWVKACDNSECADFSNADSGYRKLNRPTNLQASDGTSIEMIGLTWDAVNGATVYKVYRAVTSTGEKTLLKSLAGTAYNDRAVKAGTRYYYWVTACNTLVCSDFSSADTGFRKLIPPPALQASDGTYTDYVHISWTVVDGTTFYNLYRSTSLNGEKTLLRSPIGTLFYDRTAEPGIKYYYWVTACFKKGANYGCSDYSTANTGYR